MELWDLKTFAHRVRYYQQVEVQEETIPPETDTCHSSGIPRGEENHNSSQTTTETQPLLSQTETSRNSHTEDEDHSTLQTTTEVQPLLSQADTCPDSETEEENQPEVSSIAGVVLVITSTAVFALADRSMTLCKGAGVVPSHLLVFRSISLFILNLVAMLFLALAKMCTTTEPPQSDVKMISWVPMILTVGMGTTLTTVLIPLSYLFKIPSESFQAYLFAVVPTYTAILAYGYMAEKFATRKFSSLALCFLGTFIFITGVPKPNNNADKMAETPIIALFLPILTATACVVARSLLKNNFHPTTLMCSVQLTSILFLLPFNLKYLYDTGTYWNTLNYSTEVWMAICGHIVSHGTASYLFYFGLKYEKAGIVQTLQSGIIPCSLILGYVMTGKVPFVSESVGGAFVAVGVVGMVVMTCMDSQVCGNDGNDVQVAGSLE